VKIKRLIARLDIKGPNLVKGIGFEGLRVLGKPSAFAKRYYADGIDELSYQDVKASLHQQRFLKDIIKETASGIFIPLTVGGGLKNLQDIEAVFNFGADRVAINTAAIYRPELIREASRNFGSSNLVINVEAVKESDGSYGAFCNNARDETGWDVVDWCRKIEDLGASEIVLSAVGRDGTGEGFDLDLVGSVCERIDLPVIAHGGALNVDHIVELFTQTSAAGAMLASSLHYGCLDHVGNTESRFERGGNVKFLRDKRSFSNFQEISVGEIKNALRESGVHCR
jgi:imidazole glycerol-phosphate synthase subunit HisF